MKKEIPHFNTFEEYYLYLTQAGEEPKEYVPKEEPPKKRRKKDAAVLQTD